MASSLKSWIEIGAPDKGDLEEDSYKILKQFYMKRKDLLYLNKDGIVSCKRKEEDKVLYKYNSIVLPQLYQTELLFRSHDQMDHQGEGPQETKVTPAVKRIIRIQGSSANWSLEDMHDSHGLQSGAGNDRSFHEICRGSPLHDSVSGRNVRSLDTCLDNETRLSSTF